MDDRIAELVKRIHELEGELETEFKNSREKLNYRIEQRKIVFERDMQERHLAVKQKLAPYLAKARPMVVLTAPFIYSLIIPFFLLDLFVTLYQAVCFPVYKIEKVKRSDFITLDRRHLSYLNGIEKLNCLYCSYGNGLIAYVREISARTEAYWCPIKHAKRMAGLHQHYPEFADYGDADGYIDKVTTSRNPPKE